MADKYSVETRSKMLAAVKSKGTKPEMLVRRLLYRLGYRYRLHQKYLPGRPDLVFASRKKVVFVNGCFWHNHLNCARARVPATNVDYWLPKLEGNRKRHEKNVTLLAAAGWTVMTVWECQLGDLQHVANRLEAFPSASEAPDNVCAC